MEDLDANEPDSDKSLRNDVDDGWCRVDVLGFGDLARAPRHRARRPFATAMDAEEGVSLRRRAAAAGIAACVSAVVVNPLDVVKTRIQAQDSFRHAAAFPSTSRAGSSGASGASGAPLRAPSLAIATSGCPPKCPTTGNPRFPRRLCAPECEVYTSSFDVARKIVRQEGARALFRGTSAALLVAVPTVGIYLPCYDYGNEYLQRRWARSPETERLVPLAPAAAGAASRAFAVLCVAPLDLVRTRAQASRGSSRVSGGARTGDRAVGVWTSLGDAARGTTREGKQERASRDTRAGGGVFGDARKSRRDAAGAVRRLWTGAGPTLARDVPYSALYWFAVERLRELATGVAVRWKSTRRMTRDDDGREGGSLSRERFLQTKETLVLNPREKTCVHFFAGAVAGGAVAALTTPLDVVKTRVQIRDAPSLLDFAGGMSKSAKTERPETGFRENGAGRKRVGLLGELAAVARRGGPRALFAGWAPRAARASPTCGIVLVAYEMAKNAPM